MRIRTGETITASILIYVRYLCGCFRGSRNRYTKNISKECRKNHNYIDTFNKILNSEWNDISKLVAKFYLPRSDEMDRMDVFYLQRYSFLDD